MKRKKRKIWKTAGLLIITAAFLFSVRNLKTYVVLSGSMEPVLPVGSVAVIDQSQTAVQAGDIAAFSKEGQTVTHRIVKVMGDGYVTKGDANKEKDTGIIASQAILGTVIFCFPYLGYGILWIQEYRFLVIGTVVILLLLMLLLSAGSGKQKSEKRKTKKNKKGEVKL